MVYNNDHRDDTRKQKRCAGRWARITIALIVVVKSTTTLSIKYNRAYNGIAMNIEMTPKNIVWMTLNILENIISKLAEINKKESFWIHERRGIGLYSIILVRQIFAKVKQNAVLFSDYDNMVQFVPMRYSFHQPFLVWSAFGGSLLANWLAASLAGPAKSSPLKVFFLVVMPIQFMMAMGFILMKNVKLIIKKLSNKENPCCHSKKGKKENPSHPKVQSLQKKYPK